MAAGILATPFLHWYDGELPDADTLKVTGCPVHFTCETGSAEITGGLFTVIVALPLVKPLLRVHPAALVTLTKV